MAGWGLIDEVMRRRADRRRQPRDRRRALGGFRARFAIGGGRGPRRARRLDSDAPVFTIPQGEADPLNSYRRVAVGANYLLRRNLRLLFEPQYDLESERTRFTAGFTAPF